MQDFNQPVFASGSWGCSGEVLSRSFCSRHCVIAHLQMLGQGALPGLQSHKVGDQTPAPRASCLCPCCPLLRVLFLCRQQDLLRVLKAYTLYRPEEGYCQAQAPVAAVLLMHMPAEVLIAHRLSRGQGRALTHTAPPGTLAQSMACHPALSVSVFPPGLALALERAQLTPWRWLRRLRVEQL